MSDDVHALVEHPEDRDARCLYGVENDVSGDPVPVKSGADVLIGLA